jgi:NDP-4-keto-2,6-dideoxyhexose 3-C-methyltransferase
VSGTPAGAPVSETPVFEVVTRCRICAAADLHPTIDLGSQYLASNFVKSNEGLPLDRLRAPLSCVVCGSCGLLQLAETVDRDELFRSYFYRSATNPMMREALADVRNEALARVSLEPGDTIVDIGANDGTLLGLFPAEYRRIGVEPAKNIRRPDLDPSVEIVNAYFTREALAGRVEDGSVKLVTSVAMMYSVPELNRFVSDVKTILAPDGTWITQLSYLPSIIESLSFFDICHEHIYYFTLRTLSDLMERHGLTIVDVSQNDVNGGSIRAFVTHADRGVEPTDAVRDLLAAEESAAWGEPATFAAFMERVDAMRDAVVGYLRAERDAGRTVVGLGASTKGNVLLQYFGIDRELLPCISERNPEKVGLRTLGTDIELVSEEAARALRPSAMLVLIWFFRDELLKRERGYMEGGGSLLFPMPYPHLVGAEGETILEA